jgi:hypothetical protein
MAMASAMLLTSIRPSPARAEGEPAQDAEAASEAPAQPAGPSSAYEFEVPFNGDMISLEKFKVGKRGRRTGHPPDE